MSMTHYNKTIFIGEEGAGKTSLIYRLQYGIFNPNTVTTIGASYVKQTVIVEGKDVSLHFWDTAGQTRFNRLLPMFIRGAKIVLICFDRPDTRLVQKLIDDVYKIDSTVKIILVMTKIDNIDFHEVENLEEYALDKELPIFLTSALTGQGIQNLFEEVARYFISIDAGEKTVDASDTFELRSDTYISGGSLSQCCMII